MNLQQYLDTLGWTASDLARQANINEKTARRAVSGEAIQRRSARDIAHAVSQALGKRVLVSEIDDLKFS